jgi:hypothetical protein
MGVDWISPPKSTMASWKIQELNRGLEFRAGKIDKPCLITRGLGLSVEATTTHL